MQNKYLIKNSVAYTIFILIIFACLSSLFLWNAPEFQILKPVSILVLFFLWTLPLIKNYKTFVAVFLFTYIVEIIGKNTGLIFGTYLYDEAFRSVGILNVPFFIGLAWYIVVIPAYRIFKSTPLTILAVVGIDVLLEPFATQQKLWIWEPAGTLLTAPIQNYIAWGITTFFVIKVLHKFDPIDAQIKIQREKMSLSILLIYITFVLLLQ